MRICTEEGTHLYRSQVLARSRLDTQDQVRATFGVLQRNSILTSRIFIKSLMPNTDVFFGLALRQM